MISPLNGPHWVSKWGSSGSNNGLVHPTGPCAAGSAFQRAFQRGRRLTPSCFPGRFAGFHGISLGFMRFKNDSTILAEGGFRRIPGKFESMSL